jgi:hypothetical protein
LAFFVESKKDGQRQGQLLADVSASLINQGQTVGIRVQDESDVGSIVNDERANASEIFSNRLRRMEKVAVAIASMADKASLKRLQQPPAQGPAGAAVSIQEHAQSPAPNPGHIHQLQDTIAMPIPGLPAFGDRAKFIP